MENMYTCKDSIGKVVIDNKTNKIKNVYYGYPKDPIVWPNMKPKYGKEERYIDVTDYIISLSSKNKNIIIPGGEYKSDHHRTNFFKEGNIDLSYIMDGQIYKEILIVREDGSKEHYSKWKKIEINF